MSVIATCLLSFTSIVYYNITASVAMVSKLVLSFDMYCSYNLPSAHPLAFIVR